MCGIFVICGQDLCPEFQEFQEKCLGLVNRRGPDLQCTVSEGILKAHSSVLWLQGKEAYPQPVNNSRHLFLWNGDVFKFDNKLLDSDVSDTEFIYSELSRCSGDREILDCLSRVHGPWAFVLLDKVRSCLWYGRDFFGRQSLLFCRTETGFIISSSAPRSDNYKFTEIPANGIYRLEIQCLSAHPVLYPWNCKQTAGLEDVEVSSETIACPVNVTCDSKPQPIPVDLNLDPECIFDDLLANPLVLKMVEGLINVLTKSVRTRIQNQPNRCKRCLQGQDQCSHSCVGVLFSGGLDSALLALLTAKLLSEEPDKPSSLDLMNVAFPLPDGSFLVPDRITGAQALQEIRDLVPETDIRLVLVDVPKDELQRIRNQTIADLVNPLSTVLDDSIGCAIWFAARGLGTVEGESYQSPCRVLIAGMGIDEQLGGYSRHRIRYQREGLAGLEDELRMEILRISERNLGRDNRIISDHGVMARFPFLDEDFVNYLCSLDTRIKCNLDLPRGVGEKLILRLAAHRLGLIKTAREPKRAVQFGSRIAKLENRKEKAGDKAVRD